MTVNWYLNCILSHLIKELKQRKLLLISGVTHIYNWNDSNILQMFSKIIHYTINYLL